MSKFEKMKQRILRYPKDFTYSEAKYLLNALGYEEYTKGHTSGSRMKFYREADHKVILLHKPHPGDIMSLGAVKSLTDFLRNVGDI